MVSPNTKFTHIVIGSSSDVALEIFTRNNNKDKLIMIGRSLHPDITLSEEDEFYCVQDYADVNSVTEFVASAAISCDVKLTFVVSYQVGRRTFKSTSDDEIRKIIDINLHLPLFVVKSLLIRNPNYLSGVFFSSQATRFGGSQITLYASLKAAIECFVMGLARETGPDGFRFNCISPSLFDTKNLRDNGDFPEGFVASLPFGRLGRVTEVVNLIEFLHSPDNFYISGSVYPITGAR